MYQMNTYYCALGQRVTGLLIMFRHWLHAGCWLIETQQPSALCTLAGSSVLEKKKGLFGNIMVSFSRDCTLARCEKPQKASHFHNVTADNAQAAVMSTRPAPTQAFSIGCPLSEQNVTFYLIRTLTVRTALHKVWSEIGPPKVRS